VPDFQIEIQIQLSWNRLVRFQCCCLQLWPMPWHAHCRPICCRTQLIN